MTASDILNIATTVAVVQFLCELVARKTIFSREPYQRALSLLERTHFKYDKIVASLENADAAKQQKNAKKLQRASDEYHQAAADVAQKHMSPRIFGSLVFVVLYRIFSTEYSGRIVAVLPFAPFKMMRRLTQRTLDLEDVVSPSFEEKNPVGGMDQACAFLFVYLLCTVSVKFFVTKLVGVNPPPKASGGLATMLEGPRNKKMVKAWGVDVDELKEGFEG